MRPEHGKAWRKAGRNGREGSQTWTPQVREAVAFARHLHLIEAALADPGSNVVRLVRDRSELVSIGGE